MGLIFAEFATSMKSPKIDTAKNKPYYTSSLRVLEIAKIGHSENSTHLPIVIFAKISRREKFPIYGNKTETCVDECKNYCWLPCMVKEFDQHSGTVDPVCACQGNRAQVCGHATGSVTYYTECANTTVPCPSPSYVDFAVYYFTWLAENINRLLWTVNQNGVTTQTRCFDNPMKRAFRLCVESDFQPLVMAANNCSDLDENFAAIFNGCLRSQESCPLDYRVGVDEYIGSTTTDDRWPGVQNITQENCHDLRN